jgi:hypothetical protein
MYSFLIKTRNDMIIRNASKTLSICGSTALVDLGCPLSFLILFTQSAGILGRGISSSQGRYLHTGQHKQTSIPSTRFEPTIRAFEGEKIVHALDCAATVMGPINKYCALLTNETLSQF